MAGPVRIAILAEGRQARNEINGVGRDLGGLSRAASKAGRLVGVGLAVGTVAAVKLATVSAKAASDAQQSLGATETVYGRYADTVIRRSDKAAQAVGLSANEYRELANVTGAMLKSSELPLSKVTELTGKLNRRGADVAATFGGTTREALEAFSALLRGETDPIERYGVAIKQSDVTARLAARGQDKLTGAAGKQAAAMARLDLLFEQTASSQGQFRRESDTLAGSTQRLKAQGTNLAATLGKSLTPALSTMATVAGRDVLPPLQKLAEKYAPKVGAELERVTRAAGPKLREGLESIPDVLDRLRSGGSSGELASIGDSIGKLGPIVDGVRDSLPTLNDGLRVTSTVLKFAADNADLVAKALPFLAAGYLATKAAAVVGNVAAAASIPIKLLEIRTNQQLAASNRGLVAARAADTAALRTNTAAQAGAAAGASRLGSAARGAAGIAGLGALAAGAGSTNTALSTLSSVGGGALLGFSVGGPIGAAIGGAAGGLFSLGQRALGSKDGAEQAKVSYDQLASTLNQVTGATTEATRALIYDKLERSGTLGTLEREGISRRTAIDAVLGEGNARAQVNGLIAREKGIRSETSAEIERMEGRYLSLTANGTTPESFALLDNIDKLKAQNAARGRGIANVERSIGAVRAETRATQEGTRAKGQAVTDYAALFKGSNIPRRIVTEIENDAPQKAIDVAKLANRLNLTPKRIRTIIETLGINGNLRQVQRLRAQLRETGRTRVNLGPYQSDVTRQVGQAAKGARRGGQNVKRGLEAPVRGARAVMGPYQADVSRAATRAATAARRGGQNIKRGLEAPVRGARADVGPYTSGVTRSAGRAGQAARRGGQDVKRGLETPVRGARADLGTFNGTLRSGIGSARGTASSGGVGVGSALKAGVIAGFAGTSSILAAQAAGAVRGAIAAARAAGKVRSPSRETRYIGEMLGEGLNVGMRRKKGGAKRAGRDLALAALSGVKNGSQGVGKSLEQLTKLIEKRINLKDDKKETARERAVLKSLKGQYAQLKQNGKAQDRISQALSTQKERLNELVTAGREYAAGIKQQAVDYGSVVGLGTLGGGSKVTADRIVSQLQARAQAAAAYAATVNQLARDGLNQTTVQQLLDAGVEGGLATAEALRIGGAATLQQVNALTAQIAGTGATLGEQMRARYLQAGIAAQQGIVDGLLRNERALDQAAQRIANTLTKAVKRALGIKSPSRVFKALGEQTVAGLDLGLDDVHVRRSGARMAQAVVTGYGTPALTTFAASGSAGPAASSAPVVINVSVNIAAGASGVQAGREFVRAIDQYFAAGGSTKVKWSRHGG